MFSSLTVDSNADLPKSEFLLALAHLELLPICMQVVVCNKIVDEISSSEPVNAVQLADRLGLSCTNLKRVLSFLASFGIFRQLNGDNFIGNELSDCLRDQALGNFVRMLARHENQLSLLEMGYSIKTGEPSFEVANGSKFYQYLTNNPVFEHVFDLGIADFSNEMQVNLVNLYDFSRYHHIVDIGGGRGGLTEKILRKSPSTCATLFDRAAVIPNILCPLNFDEQLKERVKVVTGDAIFGVDVEADLYVIANMLLNFEDTDAMTIIINVCHTMKKRNQEITASKEPARLLIVEPSTDHFLPNEPSLLKRALDLLMMFLLGGRTRTQARWCELLNQCGLQVINTFEVPPRSVAFECTIE